MRREAAFLLLAHFFILHTLTDQHCESSEYFPWFFSCNNVFYSFLEQGWKGKNAAENAPHWILWFSDQCSVVTYTVNNTKKMDERKNDKSSSFFPFFFFFFLFFFYHFSLKWSSDNFKWKPSLWIHWWLLRVVADCKAISNAEPLLKNHKEGQNGLRQRFDFTNESSF